MTTNHSRDLALAIDIGGTKAAFTILDSHSHPLMETETLPVVFDSDHVAVPEKMVELIAPFVERAQQIPGNLCGIGLSNCGNINETTGEAVLVANLGWRYIPFGKMLRDAFGLPVFASTDVRTALLAELIWGKAQGVRYCAWATVGTGYGGYLFLDGKLYGGTHGFAGNFGHITLDEIHGVACGCGQTGCVETFVSGPGIARSGIQAASTGESPFLSEILRMRPITSRDVFAAEQAGDPAGARIIREVIRLLSINLSGLVNTLDLDMIVMGGGVIHGSADFVERIDRNIRPFLMTEEAARDLRIVSESFDNSALVGAAADVFLRSGILNLSSG